MENEAPKLLPPASNSDLDTSPREKDAVDNVRGALKLEASTSTPLTLAGEEISIYVVIRNPFLVPVIIQSTETHIPVSLADELGRKRERKRLEANRKREINNIGKEVKDIEANLEINNTTPEIEAIIASKHGLFIALIKLGWRLRFILSDIIQLVIQFFQPNSGDRVAVAVSPEEEDSDIDFRRFRVNIAGNVHGEVQIASYQPADVDIYGNVHGNVSMASQSGSRLSVYGNVDGDMQFANANVDSQASAKKLGIILQPGDSLVKHFVLKTTKWLFFPPVNHTFQIQVRYEVDDKPHIDTLPFSINIRAPMRSAIIGAVIGGFLGHMAKDTNNLSLLLALDKQLLIGMLRTIIFSLIVIVAFARKSSVQQVVSVEDFWGGVFTGFLVGYTGEEFIKSVLGATTTAS